MSAKDDIRAEREVRRAALLAARAEKQATAGRDPGSEAFATELADIRMRHLIEVRQPLVLIAQPNRSGGTLLSQLFDGHPQLHVHPWELEIGDRWDEWPELDLERTAAWAEGAHRAPLAGAPRRAIRRTRRA